MSYDDLIATIGVGLILLAYFFNIFGIVKKEGSLYFILNIIGAGLAGYASYLIDFIPFVILEATWVLVSFIGLLKSIKKPQE
jgi:hypothetical protein